MLCPADCAGREDLQKHVAQSLRGNAPQLHNVFHPYDVLAYRLESAVDVRWADVPPVLIEEVQARPLRVLL